MEGTFQAACSAQADEPQNSCLQKLAAGALLRARHLLCTGGETAGLDRLADRAAELYQPHKDHITQDARLRSLGGQIQKMRAAEENMPARTAGQQAELADGWLHTAAAVAASLNPYAVLARGYTMVADARGRCLTTEHLKPGQKITVIGSNAAAQCTVDAVAPTQGNPEKEQTDESTENL